MIDDNEKKQIDEFSLKTRYPQECKKLPFNYLNSYEKKVVDKCINHESLTDDELKDLKQLLADYRPYMKEYDVETAEKNIKDNIRIINSSNELLNLLDDPDRYRFDMHYKLNGEILRLQFRLKQLSDEDYMDLISIQSRVFKKLDNDEKVVYSKSLQEMELSKEEQKMQQQINDKIVALVGDLDDANERVTKFLINHVELINDSNEPLTRETQDKLWHTMDMGTKNLIYAKCKEILKIDENLEVELFPSIG